MYCASSGAPLNPWITATLRAKYMAAGTNHMLGPERERENQITQSWFSPWNALQWTWNRQRQPCKLQQEIIWWPMLLHSYLPGRLSLLKTCAMYTSRHQLTQPEGTWCFWAPEICTTSSVAKERAMQAVRFRALGAEKAKALAVGGGGGGEGDASKVGVERLTVLVEKIGVCSCGTCESVVRFIYLFIWSPVDGCEWYFCGIHGSI